MKKLFLLSLTVFLTVTSFAQGHFTVSFTGNGQDHMNINILTATIDGVALEAGDEIAAFDGAVCCGKIVLTQPIVVTNMSTFVTIAASKKDVGISNGFTEADAISYKLWDSSKNVEIFLISTQYIDPNTALPTTTPTYLANGSATVRIVGRVNKIPVANAGTDKNVNENSTGTLDGSASSDADNDLLTYKWTAPSGIRLSSLTVAKPTFTTPEVATDTQYTFSLVVNDGLANSTADQVIVTVKQVNKVPVANAGIDQTIFEGFAVTLDGSASTDGDGNNLTYSWVAPAGISLSSTTTSRPTFKAPEVSSNTPYVFNLIVNDGFVNSSVDQVIITVAQTHFDVAFTGNGHDHMNLNVMTATFDKIALEAGDEIAAFDNAICCGKVVLTKSINLSDVNSFVTIAASKKDDGLFNGYTVGDVITYKLWDVSKHIETTGVTPAYLDITSGSIITAPSFTANASSFVKLAGTSNLTPAANAGADQTVYKGATVTLDGSASSDPDNDVLTYKWTAPSGIALSSATSLKPFFTAPKVFKDSTYTFILVVNDGEIDSPADQVNVTVKRKIYTQRIPLITGWNIVSYNVTPDNKDLKANFQSLINGGNLIKVMDEMGRSIENFETFGGWKNNIGNFSPTEGYRVKMTSPDTLVLEGEAIELPLAIPLSSGWNIISYPCADAPNALSVVQTLINDGNFNKLMDESGKSIEYFGAYGGWRNNIGNFTAGKGYKIYMTAADQLTIASTLLRSASSVDVSEDIEPASFIKVYEGNGTNHMNINLVDLNTSILQEGDEIGIFDGENCVGSITINSSQMAEGIISIPASCNDGIEGKINGFIPGHQISLKLNSNGLSYNMIVEKLMGSDVFEENGSLFARVLSNELIKTKITDISVNKEAYQINCYPNPFTEELSLDLKNATSKDLTVAIYSFSGQLIKVLYKGNRQNLHTTWDGTEENGNHITPGVYLCRVNDSSKKIIFTEK